MNDKQVLQGEISPGKRDKTSFPGASDSENNSSTMERASKAELYSQHDKVIDDESKAKPANS